MDNEPNDQIDYDHPVAYDAEGKPLYEHPAPTPNLAPEDDKKSTTVDDADVIRLKHERSVKSFPELNLSEDEYVVKVITRSSIGLVPVFFFGLIILLVASALWANSDFIMSHLQVATTMTNSVIFSTAMFIVIAIDLLWVYISYDIYNDNKLFLTTENVTQTVRDSLFSKDEHTIRLLNIDDVSFTQHGVLQQIFVYGTVHVSTKGEEENYILRYAKKPKSSAAAINEAIDAYQEAETLKTDEKLLHNQLH